MNFLAFVAITKFFRLPISFEFKNIISCFSTRNKALIAKTAQKLFITIIEKIAKNFFDRKICLQYTVPNVPKKLPLNSFPNM